MVIFGRFLFVFLFQCLQDARFISIIVESLRFDVYGEHERHDDTAAVIRMSAMICGLREHTWR